MEGGGWTLKKEERNIPRKVERITVIPVPVIIAMGKGRMRNIPFNIYSGRKKYGASASKLCMLAELYFRSHICHRGLVFFVLQILDRRTILSIKPTKFGLKIL